MGHTTNLLHGILLLLVLSVGAVAAFRTLRLPPILGYLLVGALTGEYAFGWIDNNDDIAFMGEVGVVFLLFAIGLEFSVKQLVAMKTIALGLGSLQVLISTLSGLGILYYFGMSWQGGLIAGGAMAMSSTAIVVKQLTDQAEMQSQHGRFALGILLFQDIAVIPFLVAIPLLSGVHAMEASGSLLLVEVLTDAALFALMLVVGHYTLRPLFHHIARAESTELFNITILLVALTSAWITESLGLSLALGAFLAGMLLSETEYKHQIKSEIRPFRDILMGIFFITIGTKLNVGVLPVLWKPILLLVFGITVGKALLVMGLTRLFTTNNGASLRTGLVLAQGGEFGFALLALALGNQLITEDESQIVLASIVISMAISPLVIRYNSVLTKKLFADTYLRQRFRDAQEFSRTVKQIEGHVILCGYRRIGQNLARFLQEQGIPYLALDLDPNIVQATWDAGEQVYYADATRPEILMAAGLHRAKMVVITVADVEIAKRITAAVRKKKAGIPILVRTRDDRHMDELERLGANYVLPETLESTVMIAERMLDKLGLSANEVFRLVEKVREDSYQALRSYHHGNKNLSLHSKTETFLHTLILKPGDFAVGKSIGELDLQRFDVTVKSLRRGEIRGDHPAPEMHLHEGDVLVLEGKEDRFRDVKNWFRTAGKATKKAAQPSMAT